MKLSEKIEEVLAYFSPSDFHSDDDDERYLLWRALPYVKMGEAVEEFSQFLTNRQIKVQRGEE